MLKLFNVIAKLIEKLSNKSFNLTVQLELKIICFLYILKNINKLIEYFRSIDFIHEDFLMHKECVLVLFIINLFEEIIYINSA